MQQCGGRAGGEGLEARDLRLGAFRHRREGRAAVIRPVEPLCGVAAKHRLGTAEARTGLRQQEGEEGEESWDGSAADGAPGRGEGGAAHAAQPVDDLVD